MNKSSSQVLVAPQNLAASVGKNTLFGIFCNLSQVGTRLITVPIVIHHLGLDGYGIWNIIMVTATYMRFGSVGVKCAFQKYVAEATGNGDYDRASRLLSTGCLIMLLVSVVALVPVALFSHRIAMIAGIPQGFLVSSQGAISLLALIMTVANVGSAFESIVTGGHRIDLVRKFAMALTVAEALAIVIALRFGFGLFVMSAVMGASELLYILCCYGVSHQVVPQIRLRLQKFDPGLFKELFRFAGGYQLVSVFDILYASLLPFAILRSFGATSAGVYAVVTRVVTAATLFHEAFLPPILSGGTMVYASGNADRMGAFLTKAFKATLVLSLLPLGFVATFGTTLAYAWTGETAPASHMAFALVCIRCMFSAFSLLALVLYRASGKTVLDNVRQVLRILVVLGVVFLAPKLGFYGVLAGMTVAELFGMLFMFFALSDTFHAFQTRLLLPDALRLIAAGAVIIGAGVIASYLPVPGDFGGHTLAIITLAKVLFVCLLISWPALVSMGAVTRAEGIAIVSAVIPPRYAAKMFLGSRN